jgi:GTP cyclohydrolase I
MQEQPQKLYLSWDETFQLLDRFDQPDHVVYGVPKGGMIAAGFLRKAQSTHDPNYASMILDDIVDSGRTKQIYESHFPGTQFVTLIDKVNPCYRNKWVVFPWEHDHPNGEENIQDNIIRQIQFIGEDVTREGLIKTPDRVVKSWEELFSGYKKDPKDVFTTFETDGYNEIVLLKDIELYSMCEHHMLPFFGKAHIAYIPNRRIIGISKLARLLEIFARRLQVQERIGEQVTAALMEHLAPHGAACIIEADHMCIRMRGVQKQNSVMITSSIKGVFMNKPAARAELMGLIRR